MPYKIRCKSKHPRNQFRRGGVLYTTDGTEPPPAIHVAAPGDIAHVQRTRTRQ